MWQNYFLNTNNQIKRESPIQYILIALKISVQICLIFKESYTLGNHVIMIHYLHDFMED